MNTLFQIAGIVVVSLLMGACSKKTFESAGINKSMESGEGKETVAALSAQPESIIGKYWKLIEINGKPVNLDESQRNEPFIILRNEDRRVNGSGGCNTFFGTYEIDAEAKRIKFSQMASTQMLCLNMEIEDQMSRIFEMVDNYSVSLDGKYLSLNRARMAPLARFEVVYLR